MICNSLLKTEDFFFFVAIARFCICMCRNRLINYIFSLSLGNETVLTYKDNATLFKTPVEMSYKCDKVQDVNMTAVSGNSSAILLISHTQLQAYREKKDNVFGAGTKRNKKKKKKKKRIVKLQKTENCIPYRSRY